MIKEITRAVIAVLIVAGAIYAVIANMPGKEYLTAVAGGVVGYYFKEGISLGNKVFGRAKIAVKGFAKGLRKK